VKHLFIIILNIKNNAPYHFAQSLAFNLDETPTRSSKFQKVKLLCFFAKKFDFEREVEIPIIFHPYFFCQILQVFLFLVSIYGHNYKQLKIFYNLIVWGVKFPGTSMSHVKTSRPQYFFIISLSFTETIAWFVCSFFINV
jgi:hypothetical protein